MPVTRTYDQWSGVARALDVLGERWTLLVVRELLLGAKRFKELEEALEGIGPNLLTERLKRLVAEGVVEKAAVEGGGHGYALTGRGQQLEDAVMRLESWGMALVAAEPLGTLRMRPEWCVLALRTRFRPELAGEVEESYQLVVGGEPYVFRVRARELQVLRGRAGAPQVSLECDTVTAAEMAGGWLSAEAAEARGDLRIAGGGFAAARFARLFSLERSGVS